MKTILTLAIQFQAAAMWVRAISPLQSMEPDLGASENNKHSRDV